jgi:hypothetical protein
VPSRERVFRLARPLEVTVNAAADTVTCENPDLHLYGTGATLSHALAALYEDFAFLYTQFVESDDQLSPDGERLAQSLCAWVKAQEQHPATR